MNIFKSTSTIVFCFTFIVTGFGQKDKSLRLTTGVGINEVLGELKNTFRSTVAFNSGFERSFDKNWYGQLEFSFNSLRYDQQRKDANSPYLFQNTNSSLFMVGVNWGKDFRFNNSSWFSSAYVGSGYLNIGKPRVNLDEINNIVTQSIVRKGGIIGKTGGRIGLNTKSTFFQTLYIDGSYLTSSFKADGSVFRSLSFFIGMRMAMTNNDKAIKSQMKTLRRIK